MGAFWGIWLFQPFMQQVFMFIGLSLIGTGAAFVGFGPMGAAAVIAFSLFLWFNMYFTVGPLNQGVVSVLDELMNEYSWASGPHLGVPFFTKVDAQPIRPIPLPICVQDTAKDKLQVIIKGSMQFDPRPDAFTRCYYRFKQEEIRKAIEDHVSDELGQFIGVTEAETFIANREAIKLFVDCVLTLTTPPHRDPSFIAGAVKKHKNEKGVEEDMIAPDGWVRPEHELHFYADNRVPIRRSLDEQLGLQANRAISQIEQRFGGEISHFKLADVDYSQDVKNSWEEKRKAQGKREAAEEMIKLAQKIQSDTKVTEAEALNAAQIQLGHREGKVVTFEGAHGIAAAITAAIAALKK